MSKKLRYDLVPVEFDDVALILENGSEKYGERAWEEGKNFEKESNIASIKRHISAYRSGNELDKESGLNHLLHAATRLLMQYTIDKRKESYMYSYKDLKHYLDEDILQESHSEYIRTKNEVYK